MPQTWMWSRFGVHSYTPQEIYILFTRHNKVILFKHVYVTLYEIICLARKIFIFLSKQSHLLVFVYVTEARFLPGWNGYSGRIPLSAWGIRCAGHFSSLLSVTRWLICWFLLHSSAFGRHCQLLVIAAVSTNTSVAWNIQRNILIWSASLLS